MDRVDGPERKARTKVSGRALTQQRSWMPDLAPGSGWSIERIRERRRKSSKEIRPCRSAAARMR